MTDDTSVEGASTTGPTVTRLNTGPTSNVDAQTNTSTTSVDDPDLASIAGPDLDEVDVGTTPSTVMETPPTQAFTLSTYVDIPLAGSNSASEAAKTPADHEGGVAPLDALDETAFATGVDDHAPDPITEAIGVPLSNAGVLLTQALRQAGFTLANLPTSETPLTDVIVSLAVVVGGVVGAVVEVAQVPGNLVTLLAGPYGPPPPVIAGSVVDSTVRIPVDVPPLGPEVSQATQMPFVASDAPLFGSVIRASNIGSAAATNVKNELSISGLAPVPSGVSPAMTSFLDHVVRSVLVPASLTALAAIAVPGVGGLLIVCAAGVRVGYRQAKAGLALRASGIARFAGPGPMGVVRSGSLIALHPRTPKLSTTHATPAVGAKRASMPRLLESVA